MLTFLDIAIFAVGFSTCWFAKDRINQVFSGTDAYVKALEAKAAALKAAL
jgi:hypothetical protein